MTVITSGGRRWNEEPQSLGVFCAQFADRVIPFGGGVVSAAKPFVGFGQNSVEFLCRNSSGWLTVVQIGSLTALLHLRSYMNLYRCPVHFVVYFSNTPTKAHIVFNNLKFILKHLKLSYMFRSYDHPTCFDHRSSYIFRSYIILHVSIIGHPILHVSIIDHPKMFRSYDHPLGAYFVPC